MTGSRLNPCDGHEPDTSPIVWELPGEEQMMPAEVEAVVADVMRRVAEDEAEGRLRGLRGLGGDVEGLSG